MLLHNLPKFFSVIDRSAMRIKAAPTDWFLSSCSEVGTHNEDGNRKSRNKEGDLVVKVIKYCHRNWILSLIYNTDA